ncbi:MAG: hypothetical protein ACI9T8_000652 [Candidatus Saccharimonadales bacterium]|jgi:uncharacterized protein (TIRG00374 family)
MKHLIAKIHHPHLKKRAFLELGGLLLLGLLSYTQRELISDAVHTISEVEVIWFVLLLASYWLLQPLTAISYKMLTPKPKKLRIRTTMLAHLAGAGPGRVIPGGIGNLSISAVHLKKTGLSIEQAVGVVITNNIIGLFANLSLVAIALVVRPESLEILTSNISSEQLVIAGIVGVGIVTFAQWLRHARSTRKEANKALSQWKNIVAKLLTSPSKLCGVLVIAMTIALVHTAMLDFSAYALGFDLIYFDALIALSFGVAIGGVLPTPGGVGGVEAGIIAALVVLGYDPTQSTSIALLFRIATYGQPLIPGTLAYLYLRERKLL